MALKKPTKKETIGEKMVRKAKAAKNTHELADALAEGIVDTLEKGSVKQASINMETGEITTEFPPEDFGISEDVGQPIVTMSQAHIVAELTGIVLKPAQRVWAMKVTSPDMIKELNRIYSSQKTFMLKFRVPTIVKEGQITDWQDVEFQTTLADLSLKGGKATCHGYIDHRGACAMSELIQNWKSPMQFFLDGIQQSIF